MIKKKSNSFLSCDGKTSVHVVMWCPDETEYDEPVAVLQICNGMIEYIDRYDGFARYMAERGFVVVGNDHLGHGKSVCMDDDLGFFKDKNPGEALAKDAHHLTVLIKKMYPGIPYGGCRRRLGHCGFPVVFRPAVPGLYRQKAADPSSA